MAREKAIESLLTITKGMAFRFNLGSGVRFPKQFDVFNILKMHPNNKSEVEVFREKSSLASYGNIKESDTNKIVNKIGETLGVKNTFVHNKIYEMRTETFEEVIKLRLDEPVFTFASYNVDSFNVSYNKEGKLFEIDLVLGEDRTRLKLFDFREERVYETRKKRRNRINFNISLTQK